MNNHISSLGALPPQKTFFIRRVMNAVIKYGCKAGKDSDTKKQFKA
jgi:hypothetical protein